MTTLTLRGDQLGEALQFDGNGNLTTIEIGRVWFAATDTVRITFVANAFDPVTGQLIAGAGGVTGLTVTTASGQVTSFGVSAANPIDIDPDQSKNGGDFFYISESPQPGTGGAYAGLQLEKIVVVDGALIAGTSPILSNLGGWVPGADAPPPPPPPPPTGDVKIPVFGTDHNDNLRGTVADEAFYGGGGNDFIRALGGADLVFGGTGNDAIDGGAGRDMLNGGDGNDLILGGAGADTLRGDDGNDVLDGGAGRDILTGGLGGDTFVWGAGDRATDFSISQGDKIAFNAALGLTEADIIITQTAKGTVIGAAGVTGTMLLSGFGGPIDIGNDIILDYVPVFDII
ncbi:MAG TPA: calcium-binding protein [Paracoccaceae bacterium]|nr:calcium-binding protein [Paracoccaceae bacterium]HMO71810.1 calcium-binding protein [Paracoccaceae bacterium]